MSQEASDETLAKELSLFACIHICICIYMYIKRKTTEISKTKASFRFFTSAIMDNLPSDWKLYLRLKTLGSASWIQVFLARRVHPFSKPLNPWRWLDVLGSSFAFEADEVIRDWVPRLFLPVDWIESISSRSENENTSLHLFLIYFCSDACFEKVTN